MNLHLEAPEQASANTKDYVQRINKAVEEIDTCLTEMYPSDYKDRAKNDGLFFFVLMMREHLYLESK